MKWIIGLMIVLWAGVVQADYAVSSYTTIANKDGTLTVTIILKPTTVVTPVPTPAPAPVPDPVPVVPGGGGQVPDFGK